LSRNKKSKPPSKPKERTLSLRQAILGFLLEGPHTARDLSERLKIPEKDIVEHLQHIQRSIRRSGKRFLIEPASCLQCGYEFRHRSRLNAPSGCPECRSQRIEPPVFRVGEKPR
jgi:predicted Zn-ribbon and HTH transcriptional regulator